MGHKQAQWKLGELGVERCDFPWSWRVLRRHKLLGELTNYCMTPLLDDPAGT